MVTWLTLSSLGVQIDLVWGMLHEPRHKVLLTRCSYANQQCSRPLLQHTHPTRTSYKFRRVTGVKDPSVWQLLQAVGCMLLNAVLAAVDRRGCGQLLTAWSNTVAESLFLWKYKKKVLSSLTDLGSILSFLAYNITLCELARVFLELEWIWFKLSILPSIVKGLFRKWLSTCSWKENCWVLTWIFFIFVGDVALAGSTFFSFGALSGKNSWAMPYWSSSGLGAWLAPDPDEIRRRTCPIFFFSSFSRVSSRRACLADLGCISVKFM